MIAVPILRPGTRAGKAPAAPRTMTLITAGVQPKNPPHVFAQISQQSSVALGTPFGVKIPVGCLAVGGLGCCRAHGGVRGYRAGPQCGKRFRGRAGTGRMRGVAVR